MIWRIFILYGLVSQSAPQKTIEKCLTGYMTDVQSWVGEEGQLISKSRIMQYSIDLSMDSNPLKTLNRRVTTFKIGTNYTVKYLSLAKCELTRVPSIFRLQDPTGIYLYDSLEYVTFYGNTFQDISVSGEEYDSSFNASNAQEIDLRIFVSNNVDSIWSAGFKQVSFSRLKELDLRACLIRVIGPYIFKDMPKLEALYIGENKIHLVDANAFSGLNKLIHLDFSRNMDLEDNGLLVNLDLAFPSVFESLPNLKSLDVSFTKLFQKNVRTTAFNSKKLKRLSLCDTGILKLDDGFFSNTSLRILDLSKNSGILSNNNVLRGIEDTLQIFYAVEVGLTNFDIFNNFYNLEILRLTGNEIAAVSSNVSKSLVNLQILDLDANRLITWLEPTFSLMPVLTVLSLKRNNINLFSELIVRDVCNINYLALSGNFMVCNCYSRELYDLALKNEKERGNITRILHPRIIKDGFENSIVTHHTGFKLFNKMVRERVMVEESGGIDEDYNPNGESDIDGIFLLLDYNVNDYLCLLVAESKRVPMYEVQHCDHYPRMLDSDKQIVSNLNRLFALLIIPVVMLPMLIGFIFRRNFRYCLITIKNSAMLSLINSSDAVDDGTIFHYDVFVSYCNEDRGWVLDHLLPHLEKDCNVTACLHERDFQVGLSILENIVSCMDRSRCIMLILSQQFLLSQWCQFEMHLAQHRLLETRREDLTLVLLEEIPRRLRPNTLHYLMLTKTYIVWPKDDSHRTQFWRRLKKSLVTQKLKQIENVSLA